MGKKEETLYRLAALDCPRDYLDALDTMRKDTEPGRGLRTFTSARQIIGITPEMEEEARAMLYAGERVYCGDLYPRNVPDAIEPVMLLYIEIIRRAMNRPNMTRAELQAFSEKNADTFAEYKERFESGAYYLNKYWNGNQNDESRMALVRDFEPTVSDYLRFLKTHFSQAVPYIDFFYRSLPVMIPEGARKKHTYICAQTGSGKSELIKVLAHSYLRKPDFCAVVIMEPHGDLCLEVAKFKENRDSGRLVYIDPSLFPDACPVINPLEMPEGSTERDINNRVESLKNVFMSIQDGVAFTPQMTLLLKACLDTLLRIEGATLKDIPVFMDDNRNAHFVRIGKKSANSVYQDIFAHKFADRAYNPTKHGVYTKIQNLLSSMSFSEFTCGKSTVDLKRELEAKKLIIFRFTENGMGPDSFVTAGKFIAAMMNSIFRAREEIPKERRVPCHSFIDEFHNYICDDIEKTLTALRKYGYHLTLANQFIGQEMDKQFEKALGGVTVKFAGMNEYSTLGKMAREMGNGAEVEKLQSLRIGEFFVKVGPFDKERPPGVAFKMEVPDFLANGRNEMSEREWLAVLEGQKRLYYGPKSKTRTDDRPDANRLFLPNPQKGKIRRAAALFARPASPCSSTSDQHISQLARPCPPSKSSH